MTGLPHRTIRTAARWITVVAVGLAFTGCDQGDSLDALTVTPENAELTRNNESVRFRVSGGLRELSLPLTWSVSNPAIGAILASEGAQAEYVRRAAGINVVMVKDQYDAEGFATINSPVVGGPDTGYSLKLVANPDAEIPAGVNQVTITVVNGAAPFSWSVSDRTQGTVSGGTGDSVTYTSAALGENTVICTDRNGARGTILIEQR